MQSSILAQEGRERPCKTLTEAVVSEQDLPAGADEEVPHKGQPDEQRGWPPGGIASLLLLLWQHNEALQLAPRYLALHKHILAHHMWHLCTVLKDMLSTARFRRQHAFSRRGFGCADAPLVLQHATPLKAIYEVRV